MNHAAHEHGTATPEPGRTLSCPPVGTPRPGSTFVRGAGRGPPDLVLVKVGEEVLLDQPGRRGGLARSLASLGRDGGEGGAPVVGVRLALDEPPRSNRSRHGWRAG